MKIIGIEGLSAAQIDAELVKGGRFVAYQYCISIIFMTFKRSSNIYLIKDGESAFGKGLKYTLITLILGWWGIPWGPIHTIGAIAVNCKGGKNVTQETRCLFDETEM